MKKLLPFKPFFCHKVLPLTYDNSLSYYEILCKLVHSLNLTIENVNELGADFEQLYQFVINYFENLDIQEEINNAINDLIESGEFWRYFTSIIGFVTPTMYGAKGDGVTDDSEAFTDCFATGMDVKIFEGVYNIPNCILSVDHQKVECLGDVEILTTSPTYLYNSRWLGGAITATDTTGVALASGDNEVDGLTLTVTVNGTTEDIERLKKNGISCLDGTGVIKNCKILSNATGYMGIWADAHDGTNNHYVLQIHNNYIHDFYRNGIFTSAKSCDIAYNILDHNHVCTEPEGGGQIDIVGKNTQGYTTVRNNIIQNGGNIKTSGVELEKSGNAEIFDNVIDVSTTMLYGVVLQEASHAHVHDNTIIGGTSLEKHGTAIASLGNDNYKNILTTRNNWMFNCYHNILNGNQVSIISLDEHRYSGDLIYNTASHLPIIDVNNGYMWTGTLQENEGCNFYVRDVHHMKFVVERTVHIDGQPDRYIGDVMVDAINGFVVVTSQSTDFSFADNILTYANNTLNQPVNVYVMTVN